MGAQATSTRLHKRLRLCCFCWQEQQAQMVRLLQGRVVGTRG